MNREFESMDMEHALDSVFEIEELLSDLKSVNEKIQFYKDLKKFRADCVSEKIEECSVTAEKLRKIIHNTLSKHDEKTLDFPGIGKVSRRVAKGKWHVNDTNAAADYFENKGLRDSFITTKESINLRNLSKIVESHRSQGETIPGTVLGQDKESLSVTFEVERAIPKTHVHEDKQDASEELNKLEL